MEGDSAGAAQPHMGRQPSRVVEHFEISLLLLLETTIFRHYSESFRGNPGKCAARFKIKVQISIRRTTAFKEVVSTPLVPSSQTSAPKCSAP